MNKQLKKIVKERCEELKAEGAFFSKVGPVTVLMVPTCREKGYISWSICSEAEESKKWKGRLVAMDRMDFAERLPIEAFPKTKDEADNLAFLFAELVAPVRLY